MGSGIGLADNVKCVRLKPDGTNYTAAAGTSTVTSDILDTAGFETVTLLICLGAVVTGGVPNIKVQQDTDVAGATMADLAGTEQLPTDAGDNKIFIVEIVKPIERYLRTVIARATQNATVDSIVAILSGAGSRPVTSDATVGGREVFTSPAEGTA